MYPKQIATWITLLPFAHQEAFAQQIRMPVITDISKSVLLQKLISFYPDAQYKTGVVKPTIIKNKFKKQVPPLDNIFKSFNGEDSVIPKNNKTIVKKYDWIKDVLGIMIAGTLAYIIHEKSVK